MKVKAVKKKPAPVEAEQVFNRLLNEHNRRWLNASADSDKHLAEAIKRKDEMMARLRHSDIPKVCREDAIDAMEAICKSLKILRNGPSIKDLRISDMIALHKSVNR